MWRRDAARLPPLRSALRRPGRFRSRALGGPGSRSLPRTAAAETASRPVRAEPGGRCCIAAPSVPSSGDRAAELPLVTGARVLDEERVLRADHEGASADSESGEVASLELLSLDGVERCRSRLSLALAARHRHRLRASSGPRRGLAAGTRADAARRQVSSRIICALGAGGFSLGSGVGLAKQRASRSFGSSAANAISEWIPPGNRQIPERRAGRCSQAPPTWLAPAPDSARSTAAAPSPPTGGTRDGWPRGVARYWIGALAVLVWRSAGVAVWLCVLF